MDVKLPKLGEGADSGVVVTVFVKEGDTVTKDQPLIELENEKAVATIPAPEAGTVGQIFVKPGDKIAVGQRILSVDGGAAGPVANPIESAPVTTAAPTPSAAQPRRAEVAPEPSEEAIDDDQGDPSAGPPAASPTLRSLAKQLGIDLRKIRGSERGGRIVMSDVRGYIERLQKLAAKAAAAPAATKAQPTRERIDYSKWGPITVKPLSPLRQTIARRMAASWESVPRVTQFDEADVTQLLELRKQHLRAYEQKGTKLTLTPFIIRALTQTLLKHPLFNSSLDESGENLVLKSYIHIGIAVDTEAGLMVPVIRDADRKSIVELSRELEDLARRARERKVSGDDLKGGTFTISNQGGIGGGHFTPIVNVPEVAILGLGRGTLKPVWREGRFEPRTLLPIALSYDHRVIDGGAAARFTVDLIQAVEHFDAAALKL